MLHHPATEETDVSMLARLRRQPVDGAAWQKFVERYRPGILSFCLAFPLQPADAEDVAQTVLLKLVRKLRDFHYDPNQSFRGWLKAVTRNILLDYHAQLRADRGSGDSDVLHLLENVEAREGLVQQLEAEFDHELLDLALRTVQPRVPAQQWEAFRLTALEGLSGADAAAQLGMLVATVYTSKSKVQKLVREEIQRLEARVAEGPAPG